MDKVISITQLDSEVSPGKPSGISRSWDDEIIYFIMLDRFHDGRNRTSINSRSGFGDEEKLKSFCGGNLKGVLLKLDYIKSLGCTAIWLSPFLENDNKYHGYAIRNFLKVDPHFGTLEDLKLLVDECHKKDLRVIMDVVVNHSGDTWSYKETSTPYDSSKVYTFGNWKSREWPVPIELRNPSLYNKRGSIINFDEYPETLEGDLFELKSFRNDHSQEARKVLDILVAIYAYWIKETGVDGFRVDAAKHFGIPALKRFVDSIREYTEQAGQQDFFLFAEVASGDDLAEEFLNEIPGLDAVIDFPVHFILPEMIRGNASQDTFHKLMTHRKKLSKGQSKITFLDNHDQLGQQVKKRFAAGLSEEQFELGIGFLFCFPGIPCLYYGTEQGLEGHGKTDEAVRETMFALDNHSEDIFEQDNFYFKKIQEFSNIRKQYKALSRGRFELLEVLELTNEVKYGNKKSILAFSRTYESEFMLIICNFSSNKKIKGLVRPGKERYAGSFEKINSSNNEIFEVKTVEKDASIPVELEPLEILILKRINGK
ncbi:alpha-amylase family glycosyl hydrolase [Sporocytophaga myxococcoides]|uniref:alpha-amylase family glycosyl hydrolase n=1 Tax=Sporocytophaga myxococcoides TaxID=153721 RepID=UPI00040452C4|nr:alpha-amylase family glycosyl hydrolase [Sporocytophaga myxococcoides]